MIVKRLTFKFLRKSSNLSNILLYGIEIGLSIGHLSFKVGDIFNEVVDIIIKSIILILIAHDLILEDGFLSLEFG